MSGDWQRIPPAGTEVYCWFYRDGAGSDEPDLIYIGLFGPKADQRGAWFGRNEQPVALDSLQGIFLHPAISIPYVSAADRRAAVARPRGGLCAVCQKQLCPYETKALNLDGRIACGNCVLHPSSKAGDGWFGWSDG